MTNTFDFTEWATERGYDFETVDIRRSRSATWRDAWSEVKTVWKNALAEVEAKQAAENSFAQKLFSGKEVRAIYIGQIVNFLIARSIAKHTKASFGDVMLFNILCELMVINAILRKTYHKKG